MVDKAKRPRHRTGFMGLTGQWVDSADYYAAKFLEWDRAVTRLRKTPEMSAPTAVGFVTFESPESATLASQSVLHRRPYCCMARRAPEPRDIFWFNLSSRVADSSIKLFRTFTVQVIMVLLVFFSFVVITFIQGVAKPDKLIGVFPFIEAWLDSLGPGWTQFVKGVIPTVVTAAYTSSLPSVLILLSQIQGLEAYSWIDMSVLSKKPELVQRIRPQYSPFAINYVMLQATAVYPAQLLLAGPLILTWLTRLAPWKRSTPRQLSDAYYPSILTSINYGIAYPVPILVFTLGMTWSTVAPLILPFCAMFFGLAHFIYKYMLLYVNIPRYETGGIAAPMAVRRCLWGITLMQLTMMSVLAIRAGTAPDKDKNGGHKPAFADREEGLRWTAYVQMVVGVGPLLVMTGFVYWWLKHGYEKEVVSVPLE
ncbi:hypothetical protein HK097_005786, partial [Rhizophlyctis rosea]